MTKDHCTLHIPIHTMDKPQQVKGTSSYQLSADTVLSGHRLDENAIRYAAGTGVHVYCISSLVISNNLLLLYGLVGLSLILYFYMSIKWTWICQSSLGWWQLVNWKAIGWDRHHGIAWQTEGSWDLVKRCVGKQQTKRVGQNIWLPEICHSYHQL